ncbi:hypothetical protein [Fodinicola acaciae]|uniref:hypothetical protein n=1 Tax=Fodinicola acaciae TaxID=2681555 RepID=UPI0013D56602|nr:hypothetical protein [Fodinicola acaciae]
MTDPLETQAAAGRSALLEDMRLPAFDTLRGASRRRRLHNGLLAAAAIVVVAAVALIATFRPHTGRPEGGAIVAKTIEKPAQVGRCSFHPLSEKVIFHVFYAYKGCLPDEATGLSYAVTTDGGRHWKLYEAPVDDPTCIDLVPVGPHDAMMCDYITHDDGVTWVKRPGPAADVPSIPAGWLAIASGPDQNVLTAVNPRTGEQARLANGSAIGPSTPSEAPILAPDGSIWVVQRPGYTPGTGRISPDRGRTWHSVVLPAPFQKTPLLSLTTTDGRTGYALTADGTKAWALFRTTDGGATWSTVRRGITDVTGNLLPGPGTAVIEAGDGPPRISTDGGRTFRPLPDTTGTYMERTPTGVYVLRKDGEASTKEVQIAGPSLRFSTVKSPV